MIRSHRETLYNVFFYWVFKAYILGTPYLSRVIVIAGVIVSKMGYHIFILLQKSHSAHQTARGMHIGPIAGGGAISWCCLNGLVLGGPSACGQTTF